VSVRTLLPLSRYVRTLLLNRRKVPDDAPLHPNQLDARAGSLAPPASAGATTVAGDDADGSAALGPASGSDAAADADGGPKEGRHAERTVDLRRPGHDGASSEAGVHLRATVDRRASPPATGKHRTPNCAGQAPDPIVQGRVGQNRPGLGYDGGTFGEQRRIRADAAPEDHPATVCGNSTIASPVATVSLRWFLTSTITVAQRDLAVFSVPLICP
jgi:hypothetical protein